MRLPGILEVDSSDNENQDLLMKGLLLNPHPRSLQKPAITQTQPLGCPETGRGVCWG